MSVSCANNAFLKGRGAGVLVEEMVTSLASETLGAITSADIAISDGTGAEGAFGFGRKFKLLFLIYFLIIFFLNRKLM